MDLDSHDPAAQHYPHDNTATGILLSRDLIFTSKVTGTARSLGHRMLVAGNIEPAATMIAEWRPCVVFVDLTAGDLVSFESLLGYQKLSGPETHFVAFGSHVDTETLATARAVGCDPVLPRSKFAAELPDLIKRYFGD